jgi:stress response protein YsnF
MKKPISGQDAQDTDTGPVPVLEEAVHTQRKTISEEVLPLAEETARVDVRERVTGRVRVQTVVDTVEELARAVLRTEAVEVTRVPVDQVVDTAPAIRTENDLMVVPIVEEVLVVEKRLVLKEELHIRRVVSTEEVEVPVTVRKERAVVERLDPEETAAGE